MPSGADAIPILPEDLQEVALVTLDLVQTGLDGNLRELALKVRILTSVGQYNTLRALLYIYLI